jgi:hypothetical protein
MFFFVGSSRYPIVYGQIQRAATWRSVEKQHAGGWNLCSADMRSI